MSKYKTISVNNNLQLWVVIIVILCVFSCQEHDLSGMYFHGQKYRIWISNNPKAILDSPSYIIFQNNGRYEEGIFTEDIYQDSIINRFGILSSYPKKWKVNGNTLVLDKDIYLPITKKDTFKLDSRSDFIWTDYTNFIKLNGDSINPMSRLSARGFDKLFLEKYHLSHDTLSRNYFDLKYSSRKMTAKEKKEYEKNLIKKAEYEKLNKKDKIKQKELLTM